MAVEGLHAIAALTQLTVLHASYIGVETKFKPYFGISPRSAIIEDHSGVMAITSYLTGAVCFGKCHSVLSGLPISTQAGMRCMVRVGIVT